MRICAEYLVKKNHSHRNRRAAAAPPHLEQSGGFYLFEAAFHNRVNGASWQDSAAQHADKCRFTVHVCIQMIFELSFCSVAKSLTCLHDC